eukprot:6139016-Pyramimonas_sp.AAC.2
MLSMMQTLHTRIVTLLPQPTDVQWVNGSKVSIQRLVQCNVVLVNKNPDSVARKARVMREQVVETLVC